MPTFKPVVRRTDLRKDKTYNVKIRLTHHRKSLYLKTPFYVAAAMVTRKGAIKDRLVLDKVQERCTEYARRCVDVGFAIDQMSVAELVALLTHEQQTEVSFFDYADGLILKLQEKGIATYKTYSTLLKRLEVYHGSRQLTFDAIDSAYLDAYLQYLLRKGYKHGTINITMSFIKTVFNDAIRTLNNEEIGVQTIRFNPFKRFNWRKHLKLTNDVRAFDDVDTMQRIIDCEGCCAPVYKDMFIFSFTMMGINFADICELKQSDYKDGILTYCRKKTTARRADRSLMKVKVPPVAAAIIERYRGQGERLFDERISPKIRTLFSSNLQRIAAALDIPHFTFYTARHSMATFACNVCGIDRYIVHEMLNHASDSTMRVTDVYINKSYAHLWEANEKLLALFNWDNYLSKLAEGR